MGAALNGLEASLSGQSLSEYKQVVIVAQMVQDYLDLAISELGKFKDTVTLNAILDGNADLIALVKTSAAALPEALELFLTQPMSISQAS